MQVSAAAIEAAEPTLRREIKKYVWAATTKQAAEPDRQGGPGFFRRLLELAGATEAPSTLDDAGRSIWAAHLKRNLWCRVGAGVDAALGRLRAAGFRLAVVSNSEGTVENMLNEVGLASHFQTIVDSWVVGVAKPDPQIFQIALARLDVAAGEAVMVGDTPAADIVGARSAGIGGVLLDPLELHTTDTTVGDAPRFSDVPAFVESFVETFGDAFVESFVDGR